MNEESVIGNMANSGLTIQIVGWNSASQLPATLKALQSIPAGEVIFRYIDNNSDDDSVAIVKNHLPQADIIELPANHGFAGAHNIGFARVSTEFVLTHDPDVQISWPGIKQLLKSFSDPKVGALQGKLMRTLEAGVIDSAGINLTLTLNGDERGAGQKDTGQFNKPADLIAVTGACGLYRMSALKEVAHTRDEIFDRHFFAYKEDVDLGWRLTRAGWKVIYRPIQMGTHVRTLGQRGRLPWGLKARGLYARLRTPRTRYSLRNYVWMLIKNMTWRDELKHDLFICVRLGYFFVLSLLYPPLLTVWPEILRGIPNMLKKRAQMTSQNI